MPCRDWDEPLSSSNMNAVQNAKSDLKRVVQKNHLLARLLCEAGNLLIENNLNKNMSEELISWLERHNISDKENQ